MALGRALATRNARIFFGGSMVAWTGLWMHRIAVGWLAWELTRSAFWVGIVAFSDLAPAAFISPVAGAVADGAGASGDAGSGAWASVSVTPRSSGSGGR